MNIKVLEIFSEIAPLIRGPENREEFNNLRNKWLQRERNTSVSAQKNNTSCLDKRDDQKKLDI